MKGKMIYELFFTYLCKYNKTQKETKWSNVVSWNDKSLRISVSIYYVVVVRWKREWMWGENGALSQKIRFSMVVWSAA